ncbi:MAG: Localization factor PodJS [Caulobacter sp. 12-67-6]|nr:MAG: Localization factor PodJS [Caulobacter sp. 12-67-6]OYX72493.1 MAG: Localization factor PodJS [Caulobacter sp. 32-67-35]
MTAAAPWSVKGIDPKAREVAKDLARRSGMTLGEWLNRMIIEGEGPGADAPAADAFGGGAQDRSPKPYLHIASHGDTPPRIEIAEHPADEVGRVAIALDRLTDRIEAAEGRSAAAINGIDQSVRGALSRLALSEREQIAVAARFEGAVDEIKTEQTRAAERLRRMEAEAVGPRSAEALRALEGALGKVAGHLYEGEARTREAIAALEARLDAQPAATSDPTAVVEEVVARLGQRLEAAETRTAEALRELGSSFSALDGRLQAVEGANPATGVQERLDQLAGDLTKRMEAARLEMATKLRDSADGRFDRMEKKLGEMTAHVQAAEHRSAQAIERMGREVVGIAEVLNRRMQASEQRNTAAIEQVGGEVARIASTVEHKLNRADSVQAQALEKLGAEIARITEKLAERIGSAERRNALAIDDVGEQVTRVTDRLNQRHERSSQELIDRIRQSEERTARMLDEAREKIDSRLSDAQRKLAEAPVQAAVAAPAPVVRAPAVSPFETSSYSFGGEPALDEDVFNAPPPQAARKPVFEVAAFPAVDPEPPSFDDEDYEAADGFVGQQPSEAVESFAPASDFGTFSAPEPTDPSRPLSTREVIEQARAAARAAAAADVKAKKDHKKDKARDKPARTSLFAGFGSKTAAKPKRRIGSSVTTALMVFGIAGAMGGGVGLLLLPNGGASQTPDRVAEAIAGRKADVEVRTAEADTTPGPRAAVALSPQLLTSTATDATPPPAAPQENAQALFDEGVRKIEAKDRSGVEIMRKAANLGLPRAQFYLGKMYEMGEGGVKKDLVEARRWTERAATAGDARAMHNLALFYFKGEGGAKNSTTAANWFRKAADQGLVDSQFNLAQLYEGGWGVSQNPAEAYKWYVIAGRAGDATSKARANALRPQLTAEAQRTADRSALAFRAQTVNASVAANTAAPSNAGLGTAQRVLSQLGYYQGPRDGVASPALRMAIAAYQRDQGLPSSGALDGETLNRLSVYTR